MIKLIGIFLVVIIVGHKLYQRVLLSLAKRKGLVGHRKIMKLLLSRIRKVDLDPQTLLSLDNVEETISTQRLQKLTSLAESTKYQKSRELSRQSSQNSSDAQLAKKIGLPFLFSNLGRYIPPTPILNKTTDHFVVDVDGNEYIDFSNSLSNNYFGYQTQHQGLKEAIESVDSGAILSNYTEGTHQVIEQLKKFSNKDLVSLHMSGTEAVMQACGLARYNTGKDKIVLFAGSYHGWWDGVQAGLGSTRSNRDSIMLEQESTRTLRALRSRNDIAAVLVNPLHILFPNQTPPLDSGTLGKRVTADIDENRKQEYQNWLRQLKEVCSHKNIALVFDEIYVGHRLGWGGAQKYFGVDADIAVYGKTFGYGLPVGIVCANEKFGKRINEKFPFNFLLARGTFQGNPYIVAAIAKALFRFENEFSAEKFQKLQNLYKETAAKWNKTFRENNIPLSVSHFESIFTFNFLENSVYNWLFVYFLRDAGIYVSTIPGLGRVPLPLNFNSEIADLSLAKILSAANQMKESGFWNVNSFVPKRKIIKICMRSYLRANA
jgi:glutamate-1-semialdehyde 2,1-aminomutase